MFITYYFPPSGGPGVQRVLRFLSALPKLGWQPVVLTVKEGDYPVRDASLLAKVPPGVRVQRTFIPEPYRLYRKFTKRKEGEALDLAALALGENETLSLRERLALLLRDWLFIPDPRTGWLPFAVPAGLKLIREEKIDLIFSSAPPNTVHLVACWLKRLSGKKWVADFRDPWFKYLAPKRRSAVPRKIDEALSRGVVKHADYLVWVCEGVRKEMARTTGENLPEKETIITNGYDRSDFENLPAKRDSKFTVTYVGSLFVRYDLTAFIQALAVLVQEHKNFQQDFRLVFCGVVDEGVKEKLLASNFGSNIDFLGYQDHRTTLTKMVSSALLLLYIIDSFEGKNIPTSKLFEYLGAQRPILALAPRDSDAARILSKTRAGSIVPPNDSGRIQAAVLEWYQEWQKNGLRSSGSDLSEVEKFEVTHLTAELTRVWESVLPHATNKTRT